MPLSLSTVRTLFLEFSEGLLTRRVLESTLAGLVMTPLDHPGEPQEFRPRTEAEILAYKLSEYVCRATGADEDLSHFVHRALACMEQLSDPGDALDILSLIWQHDDFSVLVAKYRRGLISPAGMRSIILGCWALTVAGELAFVPHDEPDKLELVQDHPAGAIGIHVALAEGSRRFPALAGICPRRPADAVDCVVCDGSGHFPGMPSNLVCACGGLGWLPPARGSA